MLSRLCFALGFVYGSFIIFTDFYVHVKGKVKRIENDSCMSCDDHNINYGLNVKLWWLGLSLGSEVDR